MSNPTQPFPPRLHVLAARHAPKMLIIRRGPSRVFHLIAWDTETDQIEHGSWFRGRLYPLRCDLSFDGQWLVYFAFGPTRELYSWVALSRPPWLRAEVLWPKEDCWRGGGVFLDPGRLWLNLAPDAQPRDDEQVPGELSMRVEQSLASAGEDEGPYYRRLARDGWRRADDDWEGRRVETKEGWLWHGDKGWFLRPTPDHPTLRIFYRGYYFNRGRVFEYALDDFPALLDATVEWAGWDTAGRLVIARGGAIERLTLDDLATGQPSYRLDLTELAPPPRPAPGQRRPSAVAVPDEERYATWWEIKDAEARKRSPLGPDAEGRYHYLRGEKNRRHAAGRTGYPIRSAEELSGLARILADDLFRRPQIYVVDLGGVFVLGGELEEDVAVAGGEPVLAAGEAILEEDAAGRWRIAALNNRSYDYMPDASSWAAVDRALAGTGIDYPSEGFSELYPLDGTWEDVLATLQE